MCPYAKLFLRNMNKIYIFKIKVNNVNTDSENGCISTFINSATSSKNLKQLNSLLLMLTLEKTMFILVSIKVRIRDNFTILHLEDELSSH